MKQEILKKRIRDLEYDIDMYGSRLHEAKIEKEILEKALAEEISQ